MCLRVLECPYNAVASVAWAVVENGIAVHRFVVQEVL